MLDLTHLSLFIVASLALIVTPGPDVLYVVTRGIAQGRRAGLVSAAGIISGLLVHTALAALGLAVLLQTSALAFMVVKYAGACYLIYLGIKAFRSEEGFALDEAPKQARGRAVFLQGMLTNVLNPKVALFFLAFLPQFVRPGSSNPAVEIVALGALFAVLSVPFLGAVGYSAGRVGGWLQRKPQVASKLRWLTGSVFLVLGVRLVFLKRT